MNTTTQILLSDDEGVRHAASLLRSGELVAIPTETVYGLGANARNDNAVAAIFAAKKRPQFNPLIVHVPDFDTAEQFVIFSEPAKQIAQAFWPGAITLVLPKLNNSGLSDLVSAGLDTVAIRVPAHPVARAILKEFNGPVAAPSANPSGKISPTSAQHVLSGLNGHIAAVVDGGQCDVGLESTIIGFNNDTPVMLRPGGIPQEAIEKLTGHAIDVSTNGKITAPGQIASHYAPNALIRLNAEVPNNDEAWLGFGQSINHPVSLNLSPSGNLVEAATNLFAYLRELDDEASKANLQKIAAAPIPMKGLGNAINDRLRRAAAPR